jgi:hypothetical protein
MAVHIENNKLIAICLIRGEQVMFGDTANKCPKCNWDPIYSNLENFAIEDDSYCLGCGNYCILCSKYVMEHETLVIRNGIIRSHNIKYKLPYEIEKHCKSHGFITLIVCFDCCRLLKIKNKYENL